MALTFLYLMARQLLGILLGRVRTEHPQMPRDRGQRRAAGPAWDLEPVTEHAGGIGADRPGTTVRQRHDQVQHPAQALEAADPTAAA